MVLRASSAIVSTRELVYTARSSRTAQTESAGGRDPFYERDCGSLTRWLFSERDDIDVDHVAQIRRPPISA